MRLYGYILLLVATLCAVSCGTNKKGKLKPVSRFMVDLSSKYNGLYNANLIIDEYVAQEINQARDDYDQVLPVFSYVIDTSQGESSSLDVKTVEAKMNRLVSFKRPSVWTDDAYLTYGNAQYLAGDYAGAEKTFKYVLQNYQPENLEYIYYFKEDNSKRRLYLQARREQTEEMENRRKERQLERKLNQLEKKKISMMKDKEGKLRDKRKKLETKEREDLRKEKIQERKELQKERKKAQKELAKARKKGERLSREEAYARVEKVNEERNKEEPKKNKKSKKELLAEREERLREKRIALQEKNQNKEEELNMLDSFKLEETVFETDIAEGVQDSVSLYEKQAAIERRKQEEAQARALEEAKLLAEEMAIEDSLRIIAIQDSLLEEKERLLFDQEKENDILSAQGTYYFEEGYYEAVKKDIFGGDDGVLGALTHEPSFFEALYHLALTKNQSGQLYEAEAYLKDLYQYDIPKDVRHKAYQAVAEHYILRHDYAAANKAIDLACNSPYITAAQKGRLAYIKGQILEKAGRYSEASAAYKDCRKFHPQYEMELRASIQEILLTRNTQSTSDMVSDLKRLTRKYKNEEYKDLLFASIGELQIKDGMVSEGLESLAQSVEENKNRPLEKFRVLAKMCDVEYNRGRYVNAHKHATQIATIAEQEGMENYDLYVSRSKKLAIIALGIEAIKEQDSLLALGQLSEEELKKMAKKIIKEQRKSAVAEEINANRDANNAAETPKFGALNSTNKGVAFFAYDIGQVKAGMKAFIKKWDERPLVDNWRYASMISSSEQPDNEPIGKGEYELAVTEDKYAEVLANIPIDPKSRQEANYIIDQTLLGIGREFRQNELSLSESSAYLQKLIERNPEPEIAKEGLFWLYKNALDKNENELAQHYKSMMENIDPAYDGPRYDKSTPESGRSSISSDQKDAFTQIYDEIYQKYTAEEYEEAYERTVAVLDTIDSQHPLVPKFMLLKAFSIGRLSGRTNYIASLNDVHQRYQNSPEGIKAWEILLTLGKTSDASSSPNETPDGGPLQGFDDRVDYDIHYIIVEVAQGNKLVGQRNKVQKFNEENGFASLRLDIENNMRKAVLLDDSGQTIDSTGKIDAKNLEIKKKIEKAVCMKIGSFSSKKNALEYYNNAIDKINEFLIDATSSRVFIVSQSNYRKLTSADTDKLEHTIESYMPIFRQLYLINSSDN